MEHKLQGKKIILGITGSIAAYKAAILLRLLVKEGAEVQVLITPAGKEFITPVTLSALSGKPVESEFFVNSNGSWNSHVDLGIWADLMIIAPCSANTLGKMANAIADNLLITTYLSAKCPVFIAPAMDLDMYAHPANQRNIDILRSYGNRIIDPASGELASGLYGKGRMEEPEVILAKTVEFFETKQAYSGVKALITAGPTYEAIDPVRFIGNYSSGKMGYALAHELALQGAEVYLVSGPSSQTINHPNIRRIDVTSADDMFRESVQLFPSMDLSIMAAAVADFTPEVQHNQKIKSGNDILTLKLKPTRDIAAELGQLKNSEQFLVGFALETENELENAQKKMEKKNLDLIVLNSLNVPGAGFNTDTNQVKIIDRNNNVISFELKSKQEVAADILSQIRKSMILPT